MALPIAGLLKAAGTTKSLTGGEKKVKKEKVLPAAKEENGQKQMPGKKSSALAVRPKAKIAPRIRVTTFKTAKPKDGGPGKGGALTYDDLSNRLNTLVQNTNILNKFAKNNLENQKEETKAEKQSAERAKNAAAESKAEAKVEQKTIKRSLKAPKMNIFGGFFKIIRNIAFGTLVMETLRFFSDPKKSQAFLKFVEDNMLFILAGMGATIAALVIAPFFGPGAILLSALGMITKVTLFLGSLVVKLGLTLLKNPATWGALLFTAGAWLPAIFPWMVDEKMGATEKIIQEDFGGDREAFLKLLKEATIPEDQRNFSAFSKEGREFFAKRDRLSELYKKHTAFGSDTNILGLRYVNPSLDKAFREQIEYLEKSGSQQTPAQTPPAPAVPAVPPAPAVPPVPVEELQPSSSPVSPLVNPTPMTNLKTQRGGYDADTGLDIHGKIGDPIVSPVDGILEYAEAGHTAQMGQDSDPTRPGVQPQLSFRIKLDKPFTYQGKTVNFVYGTHLSTLDPAVANKSGIKIKQGQRLGTMGQANNVPHLHLGLIGNRSQSEFLDFRQVDAVLGGRFSGKQPLNVNPESVARQTTYEQPGDQEVLVTMPPPAAPPVMPSSGGGGIAMPQRASMETVLNNYYRFQVLGFLYKQG